jgi:uncharacterized protein
MNKISDILKITSHRPWALPMQRWQYYQEWNNALFLHWKIPSQIIKPLIPVNISLDTLNGETWVSLVAFTMQKIRPRNLPALTVISDFHEINLRAYVTKDNKPGVYFLNIEAQKIISVLMARSLSGLPYEKATIQKTREDNLVRYASDNKVKKFKLEALYEISEADYERTDIDKWLVERYCLYVDKGHDLYRYQIHHKEWNVKQAKLKKLNLHYQIGDLSINDKQPDLVHFSEGVKVLAWKREKL